VSAPLAELSAKADVLVEALPYIRTYRGRTVVVKVGGAPLEDDSHAAVMARDIALLTMVGLKVVVVHGGGPQVSQAMKVAGIEPRFIEGLRVTDDASMEIVQQVLAGSINPRLVSHLGAAGVGAVGLTGMDGRTVVATKSPGELGRVGTVSRVHTALLESTMTAGFTPVLSTVAVDRDGGSLNVNADAVACAVAVALGAAKLVFLTNVDGLYRDLGDEGSLISEITAGDLRSMLEGLSSGMRPKATAAVEAVASGVEKVHILDGRVRHALLLEIFTDSGVGTQVIR
jgi:acetylglutamate kinase